MDPVHLEKLKDSVAPPHLRNTESPEVILSEVYDAVANGRFAAAGQFFTDDIVLQITGFGPMNGEWHGRESVVAAIQSNFGLVEAQLPEVEGRISGEHGVAVLLRESGLLKATGKPYSIRMVQWFTFEAGKISRIDEIISGLAE